MKDELILALAAIYLARGLWLAQGEVRACAADNLRHGLAAPVWPVWLVVTALWPMLDAQRVVFAVLTLWDAAAARRADTREARHER